jgi:hypothetical protein
MLAEAVALVGLPTRLMGQAALAVAVRGLPETRCLFSLQMALRILAAVAEAMGLLFLLEILVPAVPVS